MQQSIGVCIRRLRREQNMTQSELGGSTFSKSYVSAVESEKLVPSKEALQYFAVCLGRPEQYFLALASQSKADALVSLSEAASGLGPEIIGMFAQEKVTLLASLLDQPGYAEMQAPESFFTLSTEMLAVLALPDQAHYYFFQGLMLQKKGEYAVAIALLEQALARESHPVHTTAILYEISNCYYQMDQPQMAFSYVVRAQRTIAPEAPSLALSSLPFQIAWSGGRISLALGLYQHALDFFERARSCLNALQPVRQVGQFYWNFRLLYVCTCVSARLYCS